MPLNLFAPLCKTMLLFVLFDTNPNSLVFFHWDKKELKKIDAVIFISPFSKSPCYFKRQYHAKDNILYSVSQKKGYPLMSNVSAARSNLNVLIP